MPLVLVISYSRPSAETASRALNRLAEAKGAVELLLAEIGLPAAVLAEVAPDAVEELNGVTVRRFSTTKVDMAKAELARAHGCDHAIVYTRENFTARVKEITGGKGVRVVYDSIGKDTFMGSLECLQPLGMMVLFGAVPLFAAAMRYW